MVVPCRRPGFGFRIKGDPLEKGYSPISVLPGGRTWGSRYNDPHEVAKSWT